LTLAKTAQDAGVDNPGEELYDWQSEMASLEDDIRESPQEAVSALDDLLRRMLEDSGYDLTESVTREGDEREVVAEYLAAHEIRMLLDRGADGISPGDVAEAINDYRELFDFLVENRGSTDADFSAAED
jgi:hypothetical protein